MSHPRFVLRLIAALTVLAGAFVAGPVVALAAEPVAAGSDALSRGKYLFDAAGCANCHTDRSKKGAPLGGGPALKTPFGTFYGPNISPHRSHGIGTWSTADFIRAMREGRAPDGRHYYPSFPYGAFTLMTDNDLKDLKAYIFSLAPVARPSRRHDLKFPFNIRWSLWLWKALYLKKGPYVARPGRSGQWNRGAYLVEALTHCAECHTPRTALGGLKTGLWMAGNGDGPDGERVPNITPDVKTGIGRWSRDDIVESLESGTLPDGDEFGSLMADVVEHGTSKLTAADRLAIAVYLKSLKPIAHSPPGKQKPGPKNK
jgi:mono/diheme cytochrome c family protein